VSAHCSLLTAHCSLLTAHCSLLTAYYVLLTTYCVVLIATSQPLRPPLRSYSTYDDALRFDVDGRQWHAYCRWHARVLRAERHAKRTEAGGRRERRTQRRRWHRFSSVRGHFERLPGGEWRRHPLRFQQVPLLPAAVLLLLLAALLAAPAAPTLPTSTSSMLQTRRGPPNVRRYIASRLRAGRPSVELRCGPDLITLPLRGTVADVHRAALAFIVPVFPMPPFSSPFAPTVYGMPLSATAPPTPPPSPSPPTSLLVQDLAVRRIQGGWRASRPPPPPPPLPPSLSPPPRPRVSPLPSPSPTPPPPPLPLPSPHAPKPPRPPSWRLGHAARRPRPVRQQLQCGPGAGKFRRGTLSDNRLACCRALCYSSYLLLLLPACYWLLPFCVLVRLFPVARSPAVPFAGNSWTTWAGRGRHTTS
jgi:hypothetical protein